MIPTNLWGGNMDVYGILNYITIYVESKEWFRVIPIEMQKHHLQSTRPRAQDGPGKAWRCSTS